MTQQEINELVEKQRNYFLAGNTLNIKDRKNKLKALKKAMKENEIELLDALKNDLGKSHFEGYMCEVGLVYDELNYMIKHIKKFTKFKKVRTPLAQTIAKSFMVPSPYGVVLIMSPWNYPLLLSFDPIIEAFAAGNTVVFKPSRYSKYTNVVMKKILDSVFKSEEVVTIFGGHEENQYVLNTNVDYIFFTGGKTVGKIVYEKACEKLIPVTLELGGKSPCIVDSTAKIKLAAKRIIFGKILNAGQTCVAPDYILCDRKIKDELIKELKKQIIKQYGENPILNDSLGKIITEHHFDRLLGLIDKSKVVYGGNSNRESRKIEPTIIDNVESTDPIMQEEIFGPLLPIMTYDSLDEAIEYINSHDAPLAFYYFSTNKRSINHLLRQVRFGGGCINDTIIHLATSHMPFGGFGASGIGSYHGKKGFETFTHYKSIVNKKNIIDLPMRYQPRKKLYEKIVRMIMR